MIRFLSRLQGSAFRDICWWMKRQQWSDFQLLQSPCLKSQLSSWLLLSATRRLIVHNFWLSWTKRAARENSDLYHLSHSPDSLLGLSWLGGGGKLYRRQKQHNHHQRHKHHHRFWAPYQFDNQKAAATSRAFQLNRRVALVLIKMFLSLSPLSVF